MSAITDIQRQITSGRIAMREGEFGSRAARFGEPRTLSRETTIAAQVFRARQAGSIAARAERARGAVVTTIAPQTNLHVPDSETVAVGDAPAGFGKWVEWSADDTQLALVIFLNAADPLGVSVIGLRATDQIEIVDAMGIASFALETVDEGLSSLIGIAAAGASLTAAVFCLAAAAPLIAAGAAFAAEHFKGEETMAKPRDPWGEDPRSHELARQEGGVLICLPGAQGTYYSGEDERYWIKEPGSRSDANRPRHVRNAFFLQRGRKAETSLEAGDLHLLPWDHAFDDNAGFYQLHVIMRRGTGRLPMLDAA